jgi:hypothetical protein
MFSPFDTPHFSYYVKLINDLKQSVFIVLIHPTSVISTSVEKQIDMSGLIFPPRNRSITNRHAYLTATIKRKLSSHHNNL